MSYIKVSTDEKSKDGFLEKTLIKKETFEKSQQKREEGDIGGVSPPENDYETGDIILFYGSSWISSIIQFMTGCKYSHIAMVLKDPTYICEDMKGLYIIEANYPTNKSNSNVRKIFNGVQITPFHDIFQRNETIYWEQLDCERDLEFYQKIKDVHSKIHHLPYDINPIDWIKSEVFILSGKQIGIVKNDDTFFCSALIGYLYNKLGFMDNDIDWTIIAPNYFTYELSKFKNCTLHPEVEIKGSL